MYSRSALVWTQGVVRSRVTLFREHCYSTRAVWGRVCTRRNRWRHAISKCVQWQWMGAVGSDEERFARFKYPKACTFSWSCGTDFFIRRFLKDACLHNNRPTQYRSRSVLLGMNFRPQIKSCPVFDSFVNRLTPRVANAGGHLQDVSHQG